VNEPEFPCFNLIELEDSNLIKIFLNQADIFNLFLKKGIEAPPFRVN